MSFAGREILRVESQFKFTTLRRLIRSFSRLKNDVKPPVFINKVSRNPCVVLSFKSITSWGETDVNGVEIIMLDHSR